MPEPMGAPSGITADAPASISGVRQHDETFLYQRPGRLNQLLGIGEKRLLVADHFQLHPFRKPDFAPEPRRAHRLVRRVAAGRIRQDEYFFAINVIEQRFFRAIGQVHAPDGHRDHIRARSRVRSRHFLKAAIFPGAHDQP
jgi:hypothetical protein